jgi:hypothetical protein
MVQHVGAGTLGYDNTEGIFRFGVAVWDAGSLTWIKMTQPGSILGAGGGPATIADGADVAEGATTDLDTANTVIGRLKKIVSLLSSSLTVSGTVTANAGTNLNTSALSLEATQLLVKAKTDNLDVLLSTRLKPADTLAAVTNLVQAGGTNLTTKAASTLPAAADTALVVTLRDSAVVTNANLDVALSTRLKPADTLAAVTSLTQFNGQAIALNTGVRSAGTLRVTVATDDLVPVSNTNLDVALSTRLKPADTLAAVTNLAQLGGAAISMGTGVRGVGVQRVTIATDDVVPASQSGNWVTRIVGNIGGLIDAVIGAAIPANGVLMGLRAATANPANATGGNLVAPMGDKAGRVVVANAQVRELVSHQQTNVAAATETTIVSAGAAGVFNDLVQLIITTAGAAAQTITIKDATTGTTRFVLNYPNAAVAPGTPLILMFDPPIPQAVAASNWTVTQSLATACNYTARYVKNT